MNKSKEEIASFYDAYTAYQLRKVVRIRHRMIFRKLVSAGLKPDSRVLEVGCGIGSLTLLLARYVEKGTITAVDISEKSIELARHQVCKGYSNIAFRVSDMQDFTSETAFDFIVLPDVLEHIPIEQHAQLFRMLRKYSHADTILFIHIPSPFYLRWVRDNKPELLQIIDQPLDADVLSRNLYENDFHLIALHTYSLHIREGDYQYLIARTGRRKSLDKATENTYIRNAWNEILSRYACNKILLQSRIKQLINKA